MRKAQLKIHELVELGRFFCLFNQILNNRFINKRQHFFGLGFSRRQESCSQSCHWDTNFCARPIFSFNKERGMFSVRLRADARVAGFPTARERKILPLKPFLFAGFVFFIGH